MLMKFKKIPKEYFVTIIDRLSRFSPAYIRFERVFNDIVNKFAIGIKLRDLSLLNKIEIVESIINNSLKPSDTTFVADLFSNLENKYFNFNEISYQYLSSRSNFDSMLSEIKLTENLPKNVIWLKKMFNIYHKQEKNFDENILCPIKKILLCEGETEKILLPQILKLYNIELDEKGILLIAAGGKNQVVRKFYSMLEDTKLPFFVLLDKDGLELNSVINSKLRSKDKLYLLNSGEFEDLIPVELLEKVINYTHKNDLHCLRNDFSLFDSNVKNIENIYKKYGFGEFKKAQFAHELCNYIHDFCTKDDFFGSEIGNIAKMLID